MSVAYVDIETTFIPESGLVLAVKRIFAIGVALDDKPVIKFTSAPIEGSSGPLKAAIRLINSASLGVLHNGIGFDLPVLENLLQRITIPIHDTLLISKLMFTKDQLLAMDPGIREMPPKLYGSYSLKAFGYRLKCHKEEFGDFSKLTPEMVAYMEQDVNVTRTLYLKLKSMPNFPPKNVIDLENKVAMLIFRQQENGFFFDIKAARELYTKFLFEKGTIERRLQKQFKPMFLPEGKPKQTNKIIKRSIYRPIENYKGW